MNKNAPGAPEKTEAASFGAEWRARFDRFAARGGSSAKISGWSEHGLERRIEEIMAALDRHPLPPGAAVLDLGCGSGVYCLHLRERGLAPVGADFSPGMLSRARAALEAVEGLGAAPVVCADVLRLPLADNSFDGLINVGVLQHIEDGARALREMLRVTRPGGRLYIVTLNRFSLHGLVGHILATLRAWRQGSLIPRKHAIRRRPATLGAVAARAGAGVREIRGVYLWPRPLRFLESLFGALDRIRWGRRGPALLLPFANAFLIVLEREGGEAPSPPSA
jgi:SAM-dependent methyltransferase